MASTALPRRISPVGTPFDGDVVFALSPSATIENVSGGELLTLGVAARDALAEAITSAVAPDRP
jgi:L-aminopeptidase/D-esterase-like protein